ncbi:MAG TPA: hydrogenase iron-sulfur subunit [Methanomassiliicoccales archaeon]|nr:hydrogenase iron-sulfur subunit [Methanomassiliicoccales archaeon]
MSDAARAPRTGVFLCTCHGAMSVTLDIDSLHARSKAIEGVAHVETAEFLCHRRSRDRISEAIKSERLDRVVIGACSPLLYLKEFEEAAGRSGLMPSMVEMTNLREQCSWVHKDKKQASKKAEDMIAMAVAKLRQAKPNDEGTKVKVKDEACSGCGVCQATCRVNAIKMLDITGKPGHRLASVNPAVCEGCGACVAACPSAAMDQARFSNAEVTAEIDSLTPSLESETERFPNVIVFACHWCSYAAADLAGIKRLQISPEFRVIRTMCSARIDPEWVMRALSRGVDGVLILAGKPGRCHYEVGSIRTNRRMSLLNAVIKQLGFDEHRFRTIFVDSDEPEAFQKNVDDFIKLIKDIGPNPMRIPEPEEPQTVPLQFDSISEAQMKARGLL